MAQCLTYNIILSIVILIEEITVSVYGCNAKDYHEGDKRDSKTIWCYRVSPVLVSSSDAWHFAMAVMDLAFFSLHIDLIYHPRPSSGGHV